MIDSPPNCGPILTEMMLPLPLKERTRLEVRILKSGTNLRSIQKFYD